MAAEHGVSVDEAGFRTLMQEQRERARADAKSKKGGGADLSAYSQLLDEGASEFVGYDALTSDARIRGLVSEGGAVDRAAAGDTLDLVLDVTPFYAEAGGQRADRGIVHGDGFTARVLDVQAPLKGLSAHRIEVLEGELTRGADVFAEVDPDHRFAAAQAHSATHLVHSALRTVLGPHAVQAGSLNQPGYMRFDYAYPDALTPAMREEIEDAANVAVRDDLAVSYEYLPLEDAKRSGALALFGEKYPSVVRVVDIGGPFSRELCGGTHIGRTSQVGPISLLSEASVGSGTRRVEASVGLDAFRGLARERTILRSLSEMLKVPGTDVPGRVESLLERLKDAERRIAEMGRDRVLAASAEAVASARDVAGVRYSATDLGDVADAGDVRSFVTDVRNRIEADAVVVAAAGTVGGKPSVVIAASAGAQARGLRAGDLVKRACGELGGGGGGKPDLAQGGGQDPTRIPQALDAVAAAITDA